MAERTTTFPDGPEMKAFRAVEAILREDPGLLAGGVRFRTYNGDQMDGQAPSSGQCPLLRMSPEVTRDDSPLTQAKSVAHFSIKVEIFAAGLIAEDVVNFWAAVRAAMVRTKPFRDTNVQCFLNREAGIHRSSVTLPGFGAWKGDKAPDSGLAGHGRIAVEILVNA